MPDQADHCTVTAVSRSDSHSFSKTNCESITLIAGMGVEGDAHLGATVKHRSRVKIDPAQPNLRQVHLIHQELLEALRAGGFRVDPGTMGENITTHGIDLLGLPRDTLLRIGPDAVVQITGLRNPCKQLDRYQKGLMGAVLERSNRGTLIRKAGVMGIVVSGGNIRTGDAIRATLPDDRHELIPV